MGTPSAPSREILIWSFKEIVKSLTYVAARGVTEGEGDISEASSLGSLEGVAKSIIPNNETLQKALFIVLM